MLPSRTIQPLVHEGVQHFSAADQAEVLADRFFTPTMTPLTAFHHRIQSEVETLLSEIHTIPSHPITQPEIRQAISQSGPWKAPGRDGVPYICFKQCISLVLPILQHLFSVSLRLGHVPAFWKVATVVAVPKPGRDPLSTKGYRPISLLPTLSDTLVGPFGTLSGYQLSCQFLLLLHRWFWLRSGTFHCDNDCTFTFT